MSSTAKVSVAIGRDELAWAKTLARREGKSLSAIVTESLAERRRLAALAEVVEWMSADQPALTRAELDTALHELSPQRTQPRHARASKPTTKTKRPRSPSPHR
jgi:hypothetical protein